MPKEFYEAMKKATGKHVFKESSRERIRKLRKGKGKALGKGKKSPRAMQEALTAAGGTLPDYMFRQARMGKLVKKVK